MNNDLLRIRIIQSQLTEIQTEQEVIYFADEFPLVVYGAVSILKSAKSLS
tara:strand:- start:54266 stop:54415 length:150 start_codon:yes stop_codon:yes gene_type:complete